MMYGLEYDIPTCILSVKLEYEVEYLPQGSFVV